MRILSLKQEISGACRISDYGKSVSERQHDLLQPRLSCDVGVNRMHALCKCTHAGCYICSINVGRVNLQMEKEKNHNYVYSVKQ